MTKVPGIRFSNFNSQLHAGADDYNIYQTLLRVISIHSSTQELTEMLQVVTQNRKFQFTAPRRS